MKIALVRGPYLNPNGILPWNYLDETYDDIKITAFKSDPARFDTSWLDLEVKSLNWPEGAIDGLGREYLLWSLLGRYDLPRTLLRGMQSLVKEYDIVHTSENFNIFSSQAAFGATRTDTSFVFTAGENIPFYPANPLTWAVKRYVNRRAEAATTTTMAGKRALIHEGIAPEDITVLPNAVDTNRFDEGPKRTAGTPLPPRLEHEFTILFVHGLQEQKGIRYLLGAFNCIASTFDGVNLLLVGNNKLPESYYQEHVGQNQDVYHIEHVPNEEISQLYNLSDVFVLPSVTIENNEEQFGMALIEAMACGTPSVVTDVGGLPHVAEEGHTSLVVPERSDKALAEAITELYHNNEKAETMGTNAYQYAREHYTPAVVGEQLYDFYTQI